VPLCSRHRQPMIRRDLSQDPDEPQGSPGLVAAMEARVALVLRRRIAIPSHARPLTRSTAGRLLYKYPHEVGTRVD
jgi:hypothetical protein